MPIRLKAIVFDYGNVISEPQNAVEIQGMAAVLNLTVEHKSFRLHSFGYLQFTIGGLLRL